MLDICDHFQGLLGALDLQGEVTELRARLKNTELDLLTQQEKATHALRALRDEITRLQQERSALRETLYSTKTTAPIDMMRQRLQMLQQENETLRRKLNDPAGSHALYDTVRQENTTLKEAVKALQQNADNAVLRQVTFAHIDAFVPTFTCSSHHELAADNPHDAVGFSVAHAASANRGALRVPGWSECVSGGAIKVV